MTMVKLTYYNAGVADTWWFDTLAEQVYMAVFRQLSVYYLKDFDKIISISKTAQKELNKDMKAFENGSMKAYKKTYTPPKKAYNEDTRIYNLWWLQWIVRKVLVTQWKIKRRLSFLRLE